MTGAGKSIKRRGSGLGGGVGDFGRLEGEQLDVDGELMITDVYIEEPAKLTYRFTISSVGQK